MTQRRGPKGPRPGSQATFIRDRLMKGQKDETILRALKKKFPASKTAEADAEYGKKLLDWYRWQIKTQGDVG